MSYKVHVFNKYAAGDELRLTFHSESVMLSDVWFDAACEVFTHRMHNQQNYCEQPVFQRIMARPTQSLRGRTKDL